MNNEDIFNICKADLAKCIDGFEKIKISGYKVIKEKRATFIPDTESFKYRISCTCGLKNFLVAGDWTDTGLPSTIESAIYSSKKCVNAIIKWRIVKQNMIKYSLGICIGASTISFVKASDDDCFVKILEKISIPHEGNPKSVLLNYPETCRWTATWHRRCRR